MVDLGSVTAKLRNVFAYNYTPLGTPTRSGSWSPANSTDKDFQSHKRKLSPSSFLPPRRQRWTWCCVASATLLALWFIFSRNTYNGRIVSGTESSTGEDKTEDRTNSEPPIIPIGQSIDWEGREIFWWEQFRKLQKYYSGWQNVVPYNEYVPEQRTETATSGKGSPLMVSLDVQLEDGRTACNLDDGMTIPSLSAFGGIPQGMPAPLFGSHEEVGLRADVCYDRINRYAPYGLGYDESQGGLGISMEGDNSGIEDIYKQDYRGVKWSAAQEKCLKQNSNTKLPRTAFVIRTWSDLKYTPHRIMLLRAIIAELSLASGGRYEIHFLIDVHDESIPIWTDEAAYNETLVNSLPEEFAGMGTLWSVSQMRAQYPGPFDEYINFSGGNLYLAYRSLHFSMQHFASKHLEYEYFWHWEMDLRVTGHYYELLDRITKWAEKQDSSHLWERNERFFVSSLYHDNYRQFAEAVVTETAAQNKTPVSGPMLPSPSLLPIPDQVRRTSPIVDVITINPLFDPSRSHWAFRDDITGYNASASQRPPTRASLITATRLSRRLLLLMHEETLRNHHTMFPEMYPASVALHYGLKVVYVPLPVYFEHEFPSTHANEVFNNAPLSTDSLAKGMGHGSGYFHGKGGSVFGPGEHVFRGATYYSNAAFAGSLWRAWLGGEGMAERELLPVTGKGMGAEESGGIGGRMCLPMMVLHPVKYED